MADWREPLTLAEAKLRLGVRTGHRDVELTRLLKAARATIETKSGHVMVRGSFTDAFTSFRDGRLAQKFTRQPVHSVEAVRYIDRDGELVDMAGGGRVLNLVTGPALFPNAGYQFPAIGEPAHIEVEYQAGYGPPDGGDAGDYVPCPEPLIQAMMLLVGHWFENHEAVVIGTSAVVLPMGVRDILLDFKGSGIG